jgi:methylenetetrahydrofolate dehydrogenase (NADP+)/methenyltetrahydrofolate cyclohydrolase
MAKLIDGKSVAKSIRNEISEEVKKFKLKAGKPGLAVILVGDDPASQSYVRMKGKACDEVGIHSITDKLPADISEEELLEKVNYYNNHADFHGLLVQLPLPKHIDEHKIIEAIDPRKDVDCFHPHNVGLLMIGRPIFQPATPSGIIELLKRYEIETKGKHAVILGRSNIVGKPMGMLLLQKQPHANSIVTYVHTATNNISQFTLQADILIAAMGQPLIVKKEMVKEGAVVIDVGTNRIDADNERGYRLVGDVDFEEVAQKTSAITPVPGGVGPMTIAMLLKNTIKAFQIHQK